MKWIELSDKVIDLGKIIYIKAMNRDAYLDDSHYEKAVKAGISHKLYYDNYEWYLKKEDYTKIVKALTGKTK